MILSIIAAINAERGLGFENKLLYWLPEDLKRFKRLTTGHTIIMGRKTFESLPNGALPNRRNVVLSRSGQVFPGAECFDSLEEALQACQDEEEVFVIGGASVYEAVLPLAQRMYLTEIADSEKEADAFFPAFSAEEWKISQKETHLPDEKHAYAYSFTDYEKIS